MVLQQLDGSSPEVRTKLIAFFTEYSDQVMKTTAWTPLIDVHIARCHSNLVNGDFQSSRGSKGLQWSSTAGEWYLHLAAHRHSAGTILVKLAS